MLFLLDDDTPLVDPIELGTVPSPATVGGVEGLGAGRAILLGSVLSQARVPGLLGFPNAATQGPIFLGPVARPAVIAGVRMPYRLGTGDEVVGYDDLPNFEVVGQPHAKNIGCNPLWNDVGSGSFVLPRADRLVEGDGVGFEVAGVRVFSGLVTARSDVQLDPGQEAAELTTHTVSGYLDDWSRVVVLPDYGAQDLSRLGPPTQDTRLFDWTMNGLGTDQGQADDDLNLIRSVSREGVYGTAAEIFPMPDVWPDPTARWMWVAEPSNPQPQGYCHFRIPFYAPRGKVQVWGCAYDQAEFWVDGVPVLTCDTPGTAQRLDLDLREDYHLLTIRAYNRAGYAGVLASVMGVDQDTGLYSGPLINSNSNWKALAYPTRSFRLNPGRVLRRLQLEAQRRGASLVSDWVLSFGPNNDSAGRPWPSNAPISIQVGTTYLDVLKQLAEDLIDFAPSPSGRRLYVYVKDQGTGYSLDTPWTEGSGVTGDLESRVRETSL